MSKALVHPAVRPLTEPAVYAPPALICGLLVLLWLLTGAGYFWPMWPAFGVVFAGGLFVAVRWGRRQPREGRRLALHGAVSTALSVAIILIWGMSHAHGGFWPVWPIVSLAMLFGLHWAARLPRRSLEVRVDELTRTRSGALDVQASELRRIERDLHDGAQARLVALSMQLGRAEERLANSGEGGSDIAALVKRAREEAAAAITELRDLARGIAPPVLADRGLEAALAALANSTPMHVTLSVDVPQRPASSVESAAYFVVAEALANAGKHAHADWLDIRIARIGQRLELEVKDDGVGGADPSGSGLVGLRRRVEALDGKLEINSPLGGPTTVYAELPCA
jgi:signal transduction histidine kinase